MIPVPSIEELLAGLPNFATSEEVCALLTMSPRTLADKTRAREIRAVKTGRHWAYPKSAVIEWVNNNLTSLATEPDRADVIINEVKATKDAGEMASPTVDFGRVQRRRRR